jgi:hypothetical protein
MSSQKPYQYKALPNPETHLRLLAIDLDSKELTCSIEVYPITELPPYEALSYAWGTQKATSFLPCNSAKVAVSPHLLEGIREIRARARKSSPKERVETLKFWRKRRRTHRLWIDAVCIDQGDNIEKAGQIPLMTEIYSNAQRVLVWLGPAADGSERVFDDLEPLENQLANIDRLLPKTDYIAAGLPSFDDPIWSSVTNFLGRPWFRRLWVIQEVALAKGIVLVCGRKSLDFDVLARFCIGTTSAGIVMANDADLGRTSLHDMYRIRTARSNSRHYSPLNLLHSVRKAEVTEPVDRIYGLLGLMEGMLAIAPDYTPKAREQYWNLYLSVATAEIESVERGATSLTLCGF